MKKILWVNLIHIYQPPWQDEQVVRQVASESYQFLVDMLKHFPSFRLTLNMTGTLIDQLAALGYEKLIRDLRQLIARGQIELTGSSQYHAFLPQLPPEEIRRQIELHERTLKKHFPQARLRGFFLPEMAYSARVGEIIKQKGYGWIILDPMSTAVSPTAGIKYRDRRTGLVVVFRNRKFSKSYPPEAILKQLAKGTTETIITATDGELYGHFHKDWQEHLKQILESKQIETSRISDYIDTMHSVEPVHLRQASWETRTHHVRSNNPFTIWYNKNNPIHRKLWQLAHLAIDAVTRLPRDPNFQWARYHLDRGLASCSWWWASEVKTSAFAPLAWSPDETSKGALELIKSIRSLSTVNKEDKIKAEKLYFDILQTIWKKHWDSHGKK